MYKIEKYKSEIPHPTTTTTTCVTCDPRACKPRFIAARAHMRGTAGAVSYKLQPDHQAGQKAMKFRNRGIFSECGYAKVAYDARVVGLYASLPARCVCVCGWLVGWLAGSDGHAALMLLNMPIQSGVYRLRRGSLSPERMDFSHSAWVAASRSSRQPPGLPLRVMIRVI